MRLVQLALILDLFTFLSCKNEDVTEQPIEYHLTIGDTVITIPDAAVRFAGFRGNPGNYAWDAYMLREYQVARDPNLPHQGSPYGGSLGEWKALNWQTRETFLVTPYNTRDARTDDNASYYYWIGTFKDQFGYGWRDTYAADANLNNPAEDIWLHPADTTVVPDNPDTPVFDGTSHLMERYRSLWRFR